MAKRFKYIKTNGRQQDWTGSFKTKEEAEQWAKKHLQWHEDNGHKLKLIEFNSANG